MDTSHIIRQRGGRTVTQRQKWGREFSHFLFFVFYNAFVKERLQKPFNLENYLRRGALTVIKRDRPTKLSKLISDAMMREPFG